MTQSDRKSALDGRLIIFAILALYFSNASCIALAVSQHVDTNDAILQAAVNALMVARARDRRHVKLYSDSRFLRDVVNKYAPMWHNNGWLKPEDGKPPANLKWHKMLFDLQVVIQYILSVRITVVGVV